MLYKSTPVRRGAAASRPRPSTEKSSKGRKGQEKENQWCGHWRSIRRGAEGDQWPAWEISISVTLDSQPREVPILSIGLISEQRWCDWSTEKGVSRPCWSVKGDVSGVLQKRLKHRTNNVYHCIKGTDLSVSGHVTFILFSCPLYDQYNGTIPTKYIRCCSFMISCWRLKKAVKAWWFFQFCNSSNQHEIIAREEN